MNSLIWLGILLCLVQSALFSGLTIGLFGLSRLKLEVQADTQHPGALKILNLRKDANFLLATLLWGNVSVNVLLTLLTDSILAGVGAFCFSTFLITIVGEIAPQAFFTRHGLRAGAILVPLVRFYQAVLFIVAKPTGMILDAWLGKEGVDVFREHELKMLLLHHIKDEKTDVDFIEGTGALNFLTLDDIKIEKEGEVIDPKSIIPLNEVSGLPVFPQIKRLAHDPFLQKIHSSGRKWVIITSKTGFPLLVLDADKFLRDILYGKEVTNPYSYCHRPIIVTKKGTKLGKVIGQLKVHAEHAEDDVIDNDLILYWGANQKRIITGADILGRLLRGIVDRVVQS